MDGISGQDLTSPMYERAAEEIGRFQGRLYAEQPALLRSLENLSEQNFMKNSYLRYKSWKELYDYIRKEDCEVPKHLCKMLIDLDDDGDELFEMIEKLPVVLCHRDFWVANIFYSGEGIRIIDWDTAGWGHMGEDIASLIADEAEVSHMIEYYQKCIPAYYKGFSEYADIPPVTQNCIHEMILILFGYRLVEWYKFTDVPEEKELYLQTLQKIYEMKAG